MVEAASIVDTVHRLVVERGYMGECPPSDWKQKAGRLAGIVILGSPGVAKARWQSGWWTRWWNFM